MAADGGDQIGAVGPAPEAPELASAQPTLRYHAFISYSHANSAAAKAVQDFIEDYRLPGDGAAPAPALRLYRDATDMRTGRLDDQINGALFEASHLLVCVSPEALASDWVRKEVAAFRALRPEGLIPLLLQGSAADVQQLVGLETRYADLSQRRRLPGFSRAQQIELVRVVARLAATDVRTLVPWHEERLKRRRLWLGAGASGVAAVLALAGAGWLLQRQATELAQVRAADEQRRADAQTAVAAREAQQRLEAEARKQGDSALALLGNGLFAPAASGLARLGSVAAKLDGGRYAQAMRFLLPRLMTFDEAARSVAPGQAARWRETNLVRGLDGALRELPGAAIQMHWFARQRPELLVIDVKKRVRLYRWPSLAASGPFDLGTVCIEAITELPAGGWAVDATELLIMSDEDTATAQVAGDAVRFQLGHDGRPSPPVPRASSTGAAGCTTPKVVQRVAKPPEPPTTASRLQFPRLRPEPAFWQPVPRRAPPQPAPAVVPLDVRFEPPYGELRASRMRGSTGDREAAVRNLGIDAVSTGQVQLGARSFALSLHITGNQSAALNICEIDAAQRQVLACGAVDMTVTGRTVFSPDHSRLLVTMSEVQEDPFKLVDVAGLGKRCAVSEHPAERVAGAAFNPGGSQLAVLTLDHELWLYTLSASCDVQLTTRFALPARAGGETVAGALVWADASTVLWLSGRGEAYAFEARSGLLQWQQAQLWRGSGGAVGLRSSPDGSLLLLFDRQQLRLVSALGGTGLSGLLDVRPLLGPGADLQLGGICDAELADSGAVWLRLDPAGSCVGAPAEVLARRQRDWQRRAPDDPALGFDQQPGLWRRTAIADRDGRSAVALRELLAPGGR